ncbi:hypothetical protein [Hydrogenobacter thermophilus]|uniref:hypothetical protein n=1 Tax=Hydrogenobacter thermophilus TaxID=940 RepID=UPI0030F80319
MRESLKLLFLIVSYNFLLEYISSKVVLPVRFFPEDLQSFITLISFDSALYLAWLFGYRNSTVLWLAYLFFFQILGLSFITRSYTVIAEYTPSFLLTLIFLWLFESPTETNIRKLSEERKRLEEDLERNRKEFENIKEQVRLAEELISSLKREKEAVEEKLNQLKDFQTADRQALLKERDELIEKIRQTEMSLIEYRSRLERTVEANRKLFELLELLQRQEEKSQKGEIANLRKERKKLVKEVLELQSLLEISESEKDQLRMELSKLRSQFEALGKERDLLALDLEQLKKKVLSKADIYREVFSFILDNVEIEDRVLSEFMHLPLDKKREFIKELLILNMRDGGEPLENMKGLRNVFKLKPKGGRIYFTYGQNKRWRVIGLIASEDDKDKERYAKEVLVKYMQ